MSDVIKFPGRQRRPIPEPDPSAVTKQEFEDLRSENRLLAEEVEHLSRLVNRLMYLLKEKARKES